jgi:hypothetical protein
MTASEPLPAPATIGGSSFAPRLLVALLLVLTTQLVGLVPGVAADQFINPTRELRGVLGLLSPKPLPILT